MLEYPSPELSAVPSSNSYLGFRQKGMEEGEAVRDEGVTADDDVDAAPDMESRIKEAMRVRVPHFKERADSLTFEGVRRLIEKDLGLETHALDEHRRFIKQLLLQCLEGGDNGNDNASKNSGETVHNSMSSNKEEVHELSDEPESKTKAKGNSSEDEKLEQSPAMGSLSGKKKLSHDNGNKEVITQIVIKKAIMKRGAYLRANSEKITMSGVRRLLEEDLELEKYSLDSHKKLISEQLELVLQSTEASESASAVKKRPEKKSTGRRRSGDDERNSVSSDDENEDKEKPRKKITKGRMQTLEGVKKRKVPPAKETKTSRKKRVNPKEEAADDDSESDDGKGGSAGDESPSSPERLKKKEVSTPVYGKQVERLKSIIKSCGMSVPPAIYKKVKQISESKRETHLVKELEGILSKEGLSANPSEKEIKEVRKKKERAKELEGIDTSNIVSSSRRSTVSRYLPPPKPKEPVEEKDSDAEEGNEDDDDDDDDEEEDDENDDGNEDSQGEDQSEDQEDSD